MTPPTQTPRQAAIANLDAMLAAAKDLEAKLIAAFPDAAARVKRMDPATLAAMSVDEKVALGNAVVDQLRAAAFKLSPAIAIDAMEQDLPLDAHSAQHASDLMGRLTGKSASKGTGN